MICFVLCRQIGCIDAALPDVYQRTNVNIDWIVSETCAISANPPAYFNCPTATPSLRPTSSPSSIPSGGPSLIPSDAPSMVPSDAPSMVPSDEPSMVPSLRPSTFLEAFLGATPTKQITTAPSSFPSDEPSLVPSDMPSLVPSDIPSLVPSIKSSSTLEDEDGEPRRLNEISALPSDGPSMMSSFAQSSIPSDEPSLVPSDMPSLVPSDAPSLVPSSKPSSTLENVDGESRRRLTEISAVPSDGLSLVPSDQPSLVPSDAPSIIPSDTPSVVPSLRPSTSGEASLGLPKNTTPPSSLPSDEPSLVPSDIPSLVPSDAPSLVPSAHPTVFLENWLESAPTSAPQTAATEPFRTVSTEHVKVTVRIDFDEFSSETGWMIVDDNGETLVGFPIGSYSDNEFVVEQDVLLEPGREYEFIIEDLMGDGLSFNTPGSYAVVYENTILFQGGGDFGGSEIVAFRVPPINAP
jgi:hypothetical protein